MKLSFLIAFLLSAFLFSSLHAQQPEPSELRLRFLDENTGIKVIPESITISSRGNKANDKVIHKKMISANGSVSVKLANGVYDITVSAKGYKPMSTFFELNNQSLKANFNLVRITPIKILSAESIDKMHKSNAMVILGYVVDEKTGNPLPNVLVRSKDKKASATTNADGFFKLTLQLPAAGSNVNDRATLLFTRNGYTTEVRKNFDMWPHGDLLLQIRMNKGTGKNEKNVLSRPASISTLKI